MNPILIDLGIIQIYWYSVIVLIAMLLGSYIFLIRARKKGYKDQFITNLIFYIIIFGIIGARLYYVIFNLDYYISHPLEIMAVWNGGLAIHGGLIGGFLCLVYHCKKYKKSILKLTDLLVPSVILAQAIGRWGNFFNGEAHGPEVAKTTLENMHLPTFIINGMNIDGVYYKPTFLYESIWDLLGFVVLIILSKKLKLKKGQLTGIYLIWYSTARFFIEGLRTDSLMFFGLKIAQIISIIMFITGVYLVFREKKDTRINRLKEGTEENERNL